MLLILLTVVIALSVGAVSGGSLRDFASFRIRWTWLAAAGVALQLAPVTGSIGYVVLLASFALLIAFAAANLRRPGFLMIVSGLLLNAAVIAADHGMPVTRDALVGSRQSATLPELIRSGGTKHHLAAEGTALLVLGDVIGIGWPIDQAVSVGDVCVHLGVAWCIVVAMRPRRYPSLPIGIEAQSVA